MDIKSKSIKYALTTKIVIAIIAWLSFMGMIGSSFYLLYFLDSERAGSYYETSSFQNEFTNLVHNVVELNTVLINEETILASSMDEYIIQDHLDRYQRIKGNLAKSKNFIYLVTNTKTGEQVTNIETSNPLELIKASKAQVFLSSSEIDASNYMIYYDDFYRMLGNTSFEVYAAIADPLNPGDFFYDDFTKYTKVKAYSQNVKVIGLICIPLFLILAAYLLAVAGRKEKDGIIQFNSIDQMYTDIHSFFVLIAAILSITLVGTVSSFSFSETLIATGIFLAIDYWIGFSYIISMTKHIKNKSLFKHSLIYVMFKSLNNFIKLSFKGKVFKVWLLLILLAYAGINSIIFAISIYGGFVGFLIGMFFLLPFNAVVLIFFGRALVSLSLIMETTNAISEGHLDNRLDTKKISNAFFGFAEDVKRIEAGLKKAVNEAVKGERMKSDLITNVSHDLKTPLTSIVTYVDLLKKENLNNEIANGYVEILEEKSGRLKHLIEDLIEASKASSGNLTVQTERVDLYELMQQARGEYDEALADAGLEIRYNVEERTFVKADGKYMWRIVENLISNVIKYSLKDSRVYIGIQRTTSEGILTIKNISAIALDITPEQLTERFVRGDTSRTTEGSGLGLSIAQSLSALQGGTFKIEIDGDLYKAIVSLPLWEDASIDIGDELISNIDYEDYKSTLVDQPENSTQSIDEMVSLSSTSHESNDLDKTNIITEETI